MELRLSNMVAAKGLHCLTTYQVIKLNVPQRSVTPFERRWGPEEWTKWSCTLNIALHSGH